METKTLTIQLNDEQLPIFPSEQDASLPSPPMMMEMSWS